MFDQFDALVACRLRRFEEEIHVWMRSVLETGFDMGLKMGNDGAFIDLLPMERGRNLSPLVKEVARVGIYGGVNLEGLSTWIASYAS